MRNGLPAASRSTWARVAGRGSCRRARRCGIRPRRAPPSASVAAICCSTRALSSGCRRLVKSTTRPPNSPGVMPCIRYTTSDQVTRSSAISHSQLPRSPAVIARRSRCSLVCSAACERAYCSTSRALATTVAASEARSWADFWCSGCVLSCRAAHEQGERADRLAAIAHRHAQHRAEGQPAQHRQVLGRFRDLHVPGIVDVGVQRCLAGGEGAEVDVAALLPDPGGRLQDAPRCRRPRAPARCAGRSRRRRCRRSRSRRAWAAPPPWSVAAPLRSPAPMTASAPRGAGSAGRRRGARLENGGRAADTAQSYAGTHRRETCPKGQLRRRQRPRKPRPPNGCCSRRPSISPSTGGSGAGPGPALAFGAPSPDRGVRHAQPARIPRPEDPAGARRSG